MMTHFCEAILLVYFTAAVFANSTVKKHAKSDKDMKTARCYVNNNFYSGPNSKKIEQQLAEMKKEILSELKKNQTGCSGGSTLLSDVKQQLLEVKQEIRELKGNLTGGCGRKVYKNCPEIYKSGTKISGVYKIDPDGLGEFEVFCDQKTAGGGWTVFQRRRDGSVDFYREWNDYKRGFGKLNGEFWLGLDKIHRLTKSGSNKLRVDLEDVNGKTAFAEYKSFAVANEKAKYQLSFGKFSGTAGDSLGSHHRGFQFTTKDRDNDKHSSRNCAVVYKGAWWYKSCYHSNLNGLYLPVKNQDQYQRVVWLHRNTSLSDFMKKSEMKIRPDDF